MLARLFKSKPPQMIGIDIGSHSVKAVLLTRSSDGYQVDAYAMLPVPKGTVVDHAIHDIEAVGKVLKNLRKRFDRSIKNAAVAVSGSGVITKTVYMDATLTDDELAIQIEIEADNLIPYPLNEVNIDFEKMQANESDPSKVDVLLSASRTELVEARASALEIGHFDTKVMDIEAYALGRAYTLIKGQLPEDAEDKVVALVDIGANMITIAVVINGETVFIREQTFGGDQYTQSIVSFYGMTYEEAERAKLSDELPNNYVFEVLAPFQTAMIQQIRRTLQIFTTSSNGVNVDFIVVSGGSALLEGIADLLTEELSIPASVALPFAGCQFAEGVYSEQLDKESTKFMVACGLALRSFGEWRI